MQVEDTPQLKPTRSSFIRSLPESMPVDEVIERGREIGISIQPSDVHSARYYMRQAAVSSAKVSPGVGRTWLRSEPAAEAVKPAPAPAPVPPSNHAPAKQEARRSAGTARRMTKARALAEKNLKDFGSPSAQLRVLVLRLGTERARAIIEELETKRV